MKKILVALFICVLMAFEQACTCNHNQSFNESKQHAELVVENAVSMDKEYMFLNYGDTYRWYETCIVTDKYLDEEDVSVEAVSNIFQVVEGEETCYDVHVIMFTHMNDTVVKEVVEGFWVGDWVMNDSEIQYTFLQAYERLIETNITKPHSRHCVLRREIGPNDINPQYIFGNTEDYVYVDAVTGNVSNTSPAFE